MDEKAANGRVGETIKRKIEYFGGGSRRIHEIYLRKRNFSTYYHFQRLETRLPRLYLERPEERMEKKRREKKILG